MGKQNKFLEKVLRGKSDGNLLFGELCQMLIWLGFTERIRGSHHIFSKEDIEDILNLQPPGSKAKGYQVKQVRNIILKYELDPIEDGDETK